MAAKYGIPYFSNYVNSDMEPSDVRSMCPLTGDTLITVYVTHGEDQVTKEDISIKDIYDKDAHVLVLTRLGTGLAKPVRMPMTKVYRITFNIGNNETVYVDMGENHLHPVYGYDEPVQAKDLKVGMICETGTIELENDTVSMVFKVCSISAIEEIECNDEYLYCLEVLNAPDDKHRVFALANGIMTHNCRLRLDLRELRKKSGGFFGSGESTGSVGVVTINMPKIAYLSENEEEFYSKLDHMMDLAAESIKIKRKTITKLMDAGLYPYTKKYLGTFNNHFSTIGLVGMNEACLNAKWIQKDLTQPEAQSFTEDVLNHMRNKLVEYQEKYGDLYNLEATPAESTTYRFAKHDKEMYPDIITANENGEPYYTNSSHLPVGYTEDVFTALDIQDKFQTLYTSGTVFHTFLGERLPDWKVAMTLVRSIAQNYKLPYYTLSPTYSICNDHGYIVGEHEECPTCGKKTEVYSRITGYYRTVQNWNNGKTQEFADRKEYVIEEEETKPTAFETAVNTAVDKITEAIKPLSEAFDVFKNMPPLHLTNMPDALKDVPDEKIKEFLEENPPQMTPSTWYLVTNDHCPNCRIAKKLLDAKGIRYIEVHPDDSVDERIDMDRILTAPTLVVIEEGQDVKYYYSTPGISNFLKGIFIC